MGAANVLALDVGSSSVKAALVRGGCIVGRSTRREFSTIREGPRVEVEPGDVVRAVTRAIRDLGSGVGNVEHVALAVMSPACLLMDSRGGPLSRIITHQDRRSVAEARQLVQAVGGDRYLNLAGNLPIPGGMSVTSWMWLRREYGFIATTLAATFAQLSTFLVFWLTGERVIDPSNASFTGLYDVPGLSGWQQELLNAAQIPARLLPRIQEADRVAGHVTTSAARRFGLKSGTPVLSGMVDTSAAFYLTDLRPGRAVNSSGSTDVLAVLADRPKPHPGLLTRALGTGRRWLSVATLAATGSALQWAHRVLFSEMSDKQFHAILRRVGGLAAPAVRFLPLLAGSRTEIEQRTAELTGLTLGTTREHVLAAIVSSLAEASAARIKLLEQVNGRLRTEVLVTGGVRESGHALLQRDWPKRFTFRHENDATLRGLGSVAPLS